MQVRKWMLAGAASALLVMAVPGRADDTEIYLTPSTPTGSEPLVMLSLDYRANVNSTLCADVNDASCTQAAYFRSLRLGSELPASGKFTLFELLRISLKYVLSRVSGVRVGLMLNHRDTEKCEGPSHGSNATGGDRCSNGGYIARRFRSIGMDPNDPSQERDPGSLNELKGILSALPDPQGNVSHPYQGRELFFELYRYLTGGTIYNGHNGWTDYATTPSDSLNLNQDGAAYDWDAHQDIEDPATHTQYVPPVIADCTKIFTINFLFAVSQQESQSDDAIDDPLPAGLDLASGNSGDKDPFSPALRRLNQLDLSTQDGVQNITSYFFVREKSINETTRRYADRGGTREPFSVTGDPAKLIDDLQAVFSQILSVSTTFVSASIPVNVFNRATAVDNIFLAVFQAETTPLWNGDIKKLRLKRVTFDGGSRTEIVDSLNDFSNSADGTAAFGADGRIRFDALTFWSDGSSPPMQLGDANSDGLLDDPAESPQVDPANVYPGRDGRHVNRGGSGQKIPGFINSTGPGMLNADTDARRLFYDATASSLAALDANASTAAALAPSLGVPYATAAEQAAALDLLKYIRGFDVGGASGAGDGNAATVARPWLMGDPLHSRPVPINYGTISGYTSTQRPGIFIAVAGNDGLLRFIENTVPGGGAETTANQSGKEVWAFMPKSAMPVQKLLKVNAPLTSDLGDPAHVDHPNYDATFPTRPFSPHPYTLDGAPTALVKDGNGDGTVNGTDKAYLYFGMRRGGRNYYGLNVTDPRNPVLMWTITGGTGDFMELGRTFSQPRVGRVKVGTVLKDVLIFAGGYSNNKDFKALGTDDTVGNAIFVVDAVSGALVWKATGNNAGQTASATNFVNSALVDSIPSNVTALDTDGDSDALTDRILVGDSGGNVWRADLVGTNTANWEMYRLAQLGRAEPGNNNKDNDRRFNHDPDLVFDRDADGPYDGVLIGSGDREDPLDVGGVTQNRFYLIKDRGIAVGALSGNSTLTDGGTTGLTDITDVCVSGDQAVPCSTGSLARGWKLRLEEGAGEKSLAKSVTESGVVYFTTYLKAGTSEEGTCGPSEGSGLLYAVKLSNGAPTYNLDPDNNPDTPPPTVNTDCASGRCSELDSGGIPSEIVYLPPLPCEGADCGGGGGCTDGGSMMSSDGTLIPVCPKPPQPTFWRRREN